MTLIKIGLMLSAAGLVLLGMSEARGDDVDASTRAAGERVAILTCASCHGPQGHSFSPKFPVLADQHADYLVAQLQAFKAQTRGDPDALGYMWGMAAPLDDALIAGLADYYSHQSARPGPEGDPKLIARGKVIYQQGDSTQGIPPCAACHGPSAAGTDAYPRLAGQHVQYLMKQLRSFQNNMRNVAVMHGVATGLRRADMEAVATYLQSLGP
jgi:cytochrome c553